GKELVKNRVEKICGGEDTVWRGRRHASLACRTPRAGLSCSALRLRICTSPNDTVLHNMKTNLSFSTPAEVETECLVAVVLDRGEKERTEAFVATNDKA